jgi:thioredoxin 1
MTPIENRAMTEPSREEVDQMSGPLLLEFGASWCPHCQDIQTALATALAQHPEVQRISIEDGKGKPLGRSFRVKLWPTLIFMLDGKIIHQLVRPSRPEIEQGFEMLSQAQA